MQREDPEGIVIVCDFCRRDWDGVEPMIEGHHGSILCLECCQQALRAQAVHDDKYKCTMCLRFNMPGTLPRWSNPAHPEAIVCQECLYQAAKAFSRNEDVDFKFDPADYLPAVKNLASKPPPEDAPPAPPSE